MNLTPWRRKPAVEERSTALSLSMDDWLSYFQFNGLNYPFGFRQTLMGDREEVSSTFAGLVAGAYQTNGVVFACMLVRQLLFSEARFQFRKFNNGRPGNLFGNQDLAPLEHPTVSTTTGDLLARMIQDADLAGNAFVARRGNQLKRLRPDWTSIVIGTGSEDGTPDDIDADVLGYVYQPGGPMGDRKPVILLPEEVAHFAPVPDPNAHYRGMSWLTPILREITADGAATSHKLAFFQNGATPNAVVRIPAEVQQASFEQWVRLFQAEHEGLANAYKTLFLGAGADITVIGSDLQQLDFKATQGAGETRISAAAGVPPIIVGLSEGLSASTYSNYGQAKRRLSDGTMRPLWRNVAAALSNVIRVPGGAELWYDDRDIAFLKEDEKDTAEIMQTRANAIRALTDAGYEAQSVVDAVTANDLTLLVHSGLFSVQLQPAGTEMPTNGMTPGPAPGNGAGDQQAGREAARQLEKG